MPVQISIDSFIFTHVPCGDMSCRKGKKGKHSVGEGILDHQKTAIAYIFILKFDG